jgi:hypothetical protein
LRGRALELGVEIGLNLYYYPETVTEVIAVEPEDYLRECGPQATPGFA